MIYSINAGTVYVNQYTALEDISMYTSATYSFLARLRLSYPEFNKWWSNKVIPGLLNGTRSLILEIRDGKLAGVAVLKDDGLEKKICTVKVQTPYNATGIGYHLFEKSMRILDCDQPLLSVSADRILEFTRIFQKFGYEFIHAYNGLYIPQKKELAFNGELINESTLDYKP